ncbi:transaldolase family protein [Maribellus mangrovi]|uniref:transaldolase family protein n=1 Tax=Maribellus mangrovi TaxID=3133146 RepID=UPI0030ECEDA9
MIYMADSADLTALKELYDFFPLEGITTNPTILKQSGLTLSKAIDEIKKIIGDGMIHIQVMSANADDIVREAKKYKTYFDLGDNYYTKIPITPQGYKAMSILKDAGINVTATAIFTQQQALVAAKAGADFVAPYVSRLDNISSHGIDVVSDIAQNIIEYKLDTKVLAASFKTVDQIYRVSMKRAHSATISPDLLMQLIKHPMTDISVKNFELDGEGLYDIEF